jgi:hypothetical protein
MVLVLASGVWAANVIFTVQSELICTLTHGVMAFIPMLWLLGIARVNTN